MQLSFHGVSKIKIHEYIIEADPAGCNYAFKIVKIEITDRDNTHEVSMFTKTNKLTVRKISDSIIDREITTIGKGRRGWDE